jgi:hypothetical protein
MAGKDLTSPDDVAEGLGIPWRAAWGNVLRVEIPMDVVKSRNSRMSIPTLFDGLSIEKAAGGKSVLRPEWRARPDAEKKGNEPWGMTRHLTTGGPSLPELIVDISQCDKFTATVLGSLRSDWHVARFLTSAPK